MTHPSWFETSRWLRAALLLLPVVMGVALVAGAYSNRQRTYEASELLVRGQVDGFVRSIAQTLRGADETPRNELLAEALDELRGDGLRYVALLDPNGAVNAEAGNASTRQARPRRLGALEMIRHDNRIRVTAKLPLRRLARMPRGPRHFDWRRFPPWLVLEFEPVVVDRLRQDADHAFGMSAATAVALLLIAGALWWQLRRQEIQAESMERERRLAQLGEMSAVLAHEMRNPLASLKGHAQLLLERLPGDGRESKKAERIVSEARRLEELSRTLLDFVRSGNIERASVDVGELVEQAAEAVGRDRVRIENTGSIAGRLMLDPLRMNQVLVNLLHNAVQVSPEGRAVEVRLELSARALTIRVRDRGPGLAPGEEDKVFEAFHTSKTHGTGLGLAIARRIAELHGGTLTAHNREEGGAEFVLQLPAERPVSS